MTHLNGGEAHGRRQVALLPERIAEKVEARRLVEGTTLSMRAIGQQLRIPKTTLWHWKEDGGWQRPEGAPLPLDQIPRIVEQRTRSGARCWSTGSTAFSTGSSWMLNRARPMPLR